MAKQVNLEEAKKKAEQEIKEAEAQAKKEADAKAKKDAEELAAKEAAAKAKKDAEELAAKEAAAKSDGGFTPKDSEKHVFHVEMDKPSFNPKTGEKLSKAFVQTYTIPEWNAFKKHGKTLGYTTKVLWDPTQQ